MPSNTTVPNLGTELGYQNPGTVNAALDAEVVGPDPVTGTQLTREFVIPVESVSGQSPETQMLELLGLILSELKKIKALLQVDQVPEGLGMVDELADNPPAEDTVAEGTEEI